MSFPSLSKQENSLPLPRIARTPKSTPKINDAKAKGKSKFPQQQKSTPRLPLPSVGSAICGTSQDCRLLGEYDFTNDSCTQSTSNIALKNDFYHEIKSNKPSIIEEWLPPPQEAPENKYGKQPSKSQSVIHQLHSYHTV
jgi:hypothetical protein